MNELNSQSRTLQVKKNIIALTLIRGISVGISFLYVPLLLNVLESYEYGIWLTLTSIVTWISVFDIGLGNGLRNRLANSLAKKNFVQARSYVSTAYVCIFFIAFLIISVYFLLYNFFNWNEILNADLVNKSDLRHLVTIVFISFSGQFALCLINSVLYALQMPAISSFISMVGQLISFIIIILLTKVFNIVSLLVIGTVISLVPVCVLLIATLIVYIKYKEIRPSFHYFDKCKVNDIFSLGFKFFFLQIITIILFYSNNLIIAHVINNDAVVEYNIAYKYMSILNILFTIIATPIWSATTEAYALEDYNWINRINHKLIKVACLLGLLGILMLFASPLLYKFWIGSENTINFTTTALLFLYTVALIFYGCYGYILNGIGKLKIQIIATGLLAILYVPSAILLSSFWGLNGILVVFAANAFFNLCWSKIQYKKLITKTAQGIWNQ